MITSCIGAQKTTTKIDIEVRGNVNLVSSILARKNTFINRWAFSAWESTFSQITLNILKGRCGHPDVEVLTPGLTTCRHRKCFYTFKQHSQGECVNVLLTYQTFLR